MKQVHKDKFHHQYRRKSARLQNWDYRWPGAYFITICTKNRRHYFGRICDRKMELSGIGKLADVFWHEIKNHTTDVDLGAFQVMPDHVHGILKQTGHAPSLQHEDFAHHDFNDGHAPKDHLNKNSVASIIGSYKSTVTKHARSLGFKFAWQPRFYESILSNPQAFQRAGTYIINNPQNWGKKDSKPKYRKLSA